METKNPWKTIRSDLRYENPWISVTEHQVINPSGGPGIYGTIHFRNTAIGILPIDKEDHTWLVGQYRYPLSAYSWEIPEGGGPVGTDPLVSAQRELLEETGLRAGKWQLFLEMHLSNSTSDERALTYLATELEIGESQPEPTEKLALRRLPVSEAIAMVLRGEITDAISVASLLKLKIARGE